jgi:general secretion pathway protein D
MKLKLVLIASLATVCFAQDEDLPDPTLTSPRMKAALHGGSSAIPGLIVKGIVLGAGKSAGAVALDIEGGARVMARAGIPFSVRVDGEVRKLVIKRISSEGLEIEAPDQKQVAVIPSFGPVTDPADFVAGDVAYVQFTELPLLDALRMLSDQTGNNYSASVDANKCQVNVMLANVSSSSIVEEICKSHNLWFKRDERSGILRIMTVREFEKDLGGFREEQTEVFTLKYPNVPEIATAIANLYGDRVQLSFGAEEIDAGMRLDLEGRFDRFDILNERTQSAGNNNGNILGNNVNGFVNNGGNVTGIGGSSGSSGGGNGNSLYRNNLSNRRDGITANLKNEAAFQNLTPIQAERVDLALGVAGGNAAAAAAVEALRQRPATIYVTASRRNSMVVVRTADAIALSAIRQLVQRMDVQTSLVLLEVQVVSVELGDDFQSAFDFQYNDGKTVASFSRENITRPGADSGALGGGLNSGNMTFAVVSDNFRARMQFFEEKNRVKTLSTPTLLTANNEVSRLFLGEERPLVRGVSSQTIITDNNVATTPNTTTEFRNVGNTLLITPNINADRTVTLRMVQENSFIKPNDASIPVVTGGRSGRGSVENVKIDVVATRSVSGTFVAKDGLAIAVGGLIEDSNIDKRGQIPILGDIPGLGLLFQRKEKGKSRREMVIIIRPHVMSTPADSENISKDLLQRIAPAAVERLNEAGFFPDNVPIPPEISAKDSIPPLEPRPSAPKTSLIQQRKNRFVR